MSMATFSGPIRSGTVRYGAGTNTGVLVLAQTANVGFASVTTSPTAVNLFTLPAGSKILRFKVEKTTALTGGGITGVNAVFGNATTANAYQTSAAVGATAAQAVQATLDAALVSSATDNIGTADVTVTGTFTATGGNPAAGTVVVTVEYIQRNADGTTAPAYNNV